MTHKLLVATYNHDSLQFKMFCHCLNKNWQGHRYLTVVVNSITPYTTDQDWQVFYDQTKSVACDLLPDWQLEFVDGRVQDRNGYKEQAINKIMFSIDSRFEDVIVLDAKDFLLRPADLTTFKTGDRYRTTYRLPGLRHLDVYPDSTQLLDQDMSRIPGVQNMPPWIWNVDQLKKFWTYMLDRFGDYQLWPSMFIGGGTEYDSYFAFTCCDPKKPIKFLTHPDAPMLSAGGWTHQTLAGMHEQANQFDQEPTRIIWKHSRKLIDPRCLEVTRSVLIRYGIDPAFIDSVYGPSDLVPA
jgi:hypothetical protein